MTLALAPITQRTAFAWISDVHGHLPPPAGWLTGVAVQDGSRLCCVAVLERPCRALQDGRTAQVSRVAADRTTNAASKAIAAITRAALALGYARLVSYTLAGEAGTCYRAAGWWVTAVTAGGEWSRPSRARAAAPCPGPKVRWECGPAAAPWSDDAESYLVACVAIVRAT